jgi:cytochrome b
VAALVPALWASHELGLMDLHILLGETMLGLVLFRLIWGVIGSSTARFSSFLRGPRAVLRYLRGGAGAGFGHNPVGGWSVAAMLLALLVQAGLGLFVTDEDGLNSGPLSHLVSYGSARILAERHETMFYVLLGLIALHLGAILYYLVVRRDNLVTPMITGRSPASASGERMAGAPHWRFALAAGLAAGLTLLVARFL